MCSSGSRGSLYICLHHQRSQVQSPLLPCLHCFWCGKYWNCSLTGLNVHSVITFLPPHQNLAYEIILTLGQAFEVAYQLALQARKSGHGSSTLPESFDSKPSKPVPKPRVNIRKSVSTLAMLLSEGKLHLIFFFFHWCKFKFLKLRWILTSDTNSWTPKMSDCVLFTLESFHNLHPSAPIGSPFFILALHWCHQLSVWCSGIILDVCLGPATVWRRCRLIFDLLSVCTVCCPPKSLTRHADWWGLIYRALGKLAWLASLGVCMRVCV